MSRPGTSEGLREAMNRAIAEAERRKSEKETCPEEDNGCGKKLALLTLSFRGVQIMKLCRFCAWTSASASEEEKRTKLRLVKSKKASTESSK